MENPSVERQRNEGEPYDGQDRVMEHRADKVTQKTDMSYANFRDSITRDRNPQSDTSDGIDKKRQV